LEAVGAGDLREAVSSTGRSWNADARFAGEPVVVGASLPSQEVALALTTRTTNPAAARRADRQAIAARIGALPLTKARA
jgi:hypothetical protein